MPQPLGTLARLWRYPVKSMGGEDCERLALESRGIEGDRSHAVRDPQGKLGSGKATRRFRHVYQRAADGRAPAFAERES